MGTREIIQGADYSGLRIQYYHSPVKGALLSAWVGGDPFSDARRNFADQGAALALSGIAPPVRGHTLCRRFQGKDSDDGYSVLRTDIVETNEMTLVAFGAKAQVDSWGIALSFEREWIAAGTSEVFREGGYLSYPPGTASMRVQAGYRRPEKIGAGGGSAITHSNLSTPLTDYPYDSAMMTAAMFSVIAGRRRLTAVAVAGGEILKGDMSSVPNVALGEPDGLVENEISPPSAAKTLTIGGAPYRPGNPSDFQTYLAYVAMYPRALTDVELLRIYQSVKKRFDSFGAPLA